VSTRYTVFPEDFHASVIYVRCSTGSGAFDTPVYSNSRKRGAENDIFEPLELLQKLFKANRVNDPLALHCMDHTG